MESFLAGKLKSVLIGQPEDLKRTCYVLNDDDVPMELRLGLRELVDSWQKSGPNLAKMLKNDKALAARVGHGETTLVPTNTGKGHLVWLPSPRDRDLSSWRDQALTLFMILIVNPQWHRLGGPCPRCDKYYVKKTSRQKTYCSRRCGATLTAIAATRKKRQEKRLEELSRTQAAANQWATVQTRQPWKEWVSTRTNITVKWLTRAVNKGDLRAPIKNLDVKLGQ